MKYRDDKGNLVPIGDKLKSSLSAAINDEFKAYKGSNDPEKKAEVLKDICSKYDIVKFVDDDKKNLSFVKSMNLPNLQVIQARPN